MNCYVNDFTTTVKTYYAELAVFKPIEKDEELRLIKLAKENNIEARHKIITSNLRFVFSIAKKYRGRGADLDDLISEGNMGLMKAIDRFDESKNVKFFTYAVWWIRQSIQEYLQSLTKKNDNEVKMEEQVSSTHNDNIYDCEDFDYEADEILSIADSTTESELESIHKDVINSLLSKVTSRGKFIIQAYYGIGYKKPMNLEEIGRELGITKERTRQIKESSLRIIRTEALLQGIDMETLFT